MTQEKTGTVQKTAESGNAENRGRIVRIQGSVLDIEFPTGQLPDIYNALTVEVGNTGKKEEGSSSATITLEVEEHMV